MKRLLVGLAMVAAFGSAAPAEASTPMPWCGIGASDADRLPDATSGFAIHVAYVRPPGGVDRLAEWAPRIVGDTAAIDAWWRSQDPTRSPRFDLYPFACASPFGQLDISNVTLTQDAGQIDSAFTTIRFLLAQHGFIQPEKTYLVYYDGPVQQQAPDFEVCGVGDTPSGGLPGIAIVFLQACEAEGSTLRPIVAVHELVHTFDAVSGSAPHHCSDGHVCDVANDLLNASLSGAELETHVLDGGHDDYYGHSGTWPDVQDSLFLERLDSPDHAAPSLPASLTATDGAAPGNRSDLLATVHRRRGADRLSRLSGQSLHHLDDVDLHGHRHCREPHELVHGSSIRLRRPPEPAADDPLPPRPRRRRRTGEARPRHGPAAAGRPRVGATRGQDRPPLLGTATGPWWPRAAIGSRSGRGPSR